MLQQTGSHLLTGDYWEWTAHINIHFRVSLCYAQFFKYFERRGIPAQKLRHRFLKIIAFRKQIVTLTRTIKITTLNPHKRRKGFIEMPDMFRVRFSENPIGKTLQRS